MQDFPPVITAYEATPPTDSATRPRGRRARRGWTTPDTRSPVRFLLWILYQQRGVLGVSMVFSTFWMAPQFLSPWLTGKAIDEGILGGSTEALAFWAGMLAVAAVVAGAAGVLGHSMIVRTWLLSLYGTTKLVTRKSTQMGHVLPRRTPTGEILSISGSDSDTFGALTETLSNLLGSVVGFVVVTVLIMNTSPRLGVVVLIVAPLLLLTALPLLRPLQHRQALERNRSSELTSMATDIVAGLRILRGIGGERTFGDNYTTQSRRTRTASVSAGVLQSLVEAVSVAASGSFLVLLTWLGAQEVLAGRLTVGELVSFFGYAVFMVVPLQTFFRIAQYWVRALVSARKTIAVLGQQPPWPEPADPRPLDPSAGLVDDESGVVIRPGELTVVVSGVPDETSALADRLGRYLPRSTEPTPAADEEEGRGREARRRRAERDAERLRVTGLDEARARGVWGVRLGEVDLAQARMSDVRSTILVSDASSGIFAGTLQENLDPSGRLDREAAERAITVAAAEDVYTAIPGGWQGRIDERGRGLSGGQRQRLVLARALAVDPPVLVLVEPTSAVDAHTEAMIASRLAEHRAGRTTVITTVSPLLLHHADRVVLLEGGRAVADGTHEQLLADEPRYRAVVSRDLEERPEPDGPPDPDGPDDELELEELEEVGRR